MGVDASAIDDDSGNETLSTWDSMRELMLASTIEAEYGVTLSTGEMLDLHSVRSIQAILAAHGIDA
jgi:acyl carrier protein